MMRRTRAGLDDTSPEAMRVLVESYRRMPPARRWQLLRSVYRTARSIHAAGCRQRIPGATPARIAEDWHRQALGEAVPLPAGGFAMTADEQDNLRVLREVTAAFDHLGIPYALGGSMASSFYGVTRFTQDADLTAEPFPGREREFAERFGEDYYVEVESIRDAVRRRSSFNIIYAPLAFKVDVFVRKDRAFERSLMSRKTSHPYPDAGGGPISVVSPEDILLLKLEWYRLGDRISDRQWQDVLGVLRVRAGRLDEAYLDHWAADLGVADLLAEARREAAV